MCHMCSYHTSVTVGQLQDAAVYPVKACGAVNANKMNDIWVHVGGVVEILGLKDRELMFVDSKGRFVSQRRRHRLQGNDKKARRQTCFLLLYCSRLAPTHLSCLGRVSRGWLRSK